MLVPTKSIPGVWPGGKATNGIGIRRLLAPQRQRELDSQPGPAPGMSQATRVGKGTSTAGNSRGSAAGHPCEWRLGGGGVGAVVLTFPTLSHMAAGAGRKRESQERNPLGSPHLLLK